MDEGDFIDDKAHHHHNDCSASNSASNSSSRRARHNWSVFSARLRDFLRRDNSSPSSSSERRHNLMLFEEATASGTPHRRAIRFDGVELLRFDAAASSSSSSSLRSLESLATGFDNTGNVRVWPGSEALAWIACQSDATAPFGAASSFLELGAGFLGLASFVIAAKKDTAASIWITDGNRDSVASLEAIRAENHPARAEITVRQLVWGEKRLDAPRFDVILAADCVFFGETHDALLRTISSHLAADGTCWMASPRRRGSLRKFCEHVAAAHWSETFSLRIEDEWNRRLADVVPEWTSETARDELMPVFFTLRFRNKPSD